MSSGPGRYTTVAQTESQVEKAIVAECLLVATQMGAMMEFIGQRKARGAGNTKGVTDALLHCAGWTCNVEFKTRAGRLDPDQVSQMVKRLAQQVPTYVVRDKMEMVELINACRRHPLKTQLHPLWNEDAT